MNRPKTILKQQSNFLFPPRKRSIKVIKRDPESIMTDVIVNIGGDSMDESNLIAKFGKSDNIPMCKQVIGARCRFGTRFNVDEFKETILTSNCISPNEDVSDKQKIEFRWNCIALNGGSIELSIYRRKTDKKDKQILMHDNRSKSKSLGKNLTDDVKLKQNLEIKNRQSRSLVFNKGKKNSPIVEQSLKDEKLHHSDSSNVISSMNMQSMKPLNDGKRSPTKADGPNIADISQITKKEDQCTTKKINEREREKMKKKTSSISLSPHHIVSISPNNVLTKNCHNISFRKAMPKTLSRQETTEMLLPSKNNISRETLSSRSSLSSAASPLKSLQEEPSIVEDTSVSFPSKLPIQNISLNREFATTMPYTSSLKHYELIVPKHKIHSTNQPEEGHILCDPGYDYWMIMENTAMLFPRNISVLYRFDLVRVDEGTSSINKRNGGENMKNQPIKHSPKMEKCIAEKMSDLLQFIDDISG